jgi:hypothetical protein
MSNQPKLKVINLFGAPGMGKSSIRSGVFWLMKSFHQSVEEVSEYAKYLTLSGRQWQLNEEQLYLFAKQHHKQFIIERAGYEFAVTDSPLHLCDFYAPQGYYESFSSLVDDAHYRFDNINYFLTRDLGTTDFEDRGRVHSKEQSTEVEARMRDYLREKRIPYKELVIDLLTPWKIVEDLRPGVVSWPTFSKLPQ